jgi:eukaryotic-like serine/threonine-protein kinase
MSEAADSPSVESLLAEVTDEFMERAARGERPDVEDYARRYPGLAAVLRQVLPALQVFRDTPLPLRDNFFGAGGEACLGDFRILREVGRGGMGIVYEAEQVSLGRRVALKVLPLAATLDPRQLQRFKNEAQAAAHLHHTNIVPVHAVGSERGLHYYAMQFIAGYSLAALIKQMRQLDGLTPARPEGAELSVPQLAGDLASGRWAPARRPAGAPGPPGSATETARPAAGLSTERSARDQAYFRTVAQMGVQAAEALEHAHQVGIVHRDVKPANLLVDARGNTWVTDFGLSRFEGNPGLTLTGDLIGTVRYMSPEQTFGRHGEVDHRTDVYSLGVTLYELLTLQPAFVGEDRQEILRRIATEDPRPPRRLNRAVPAELETIVLKACAKGPAERYATAGEMADDLRRFLEDKPIKARRPTLWQRVTRWLRRHRTVVTAVLICAFLGLTATVTVLAVMLALLSDENRKTASAYGAKVEEERRKDEANAQLAQAVTDLRTEQRAKDQAREKERQTTYYYQVALAHQKWTANEVGQAETLLGECPEELRGWEWRYLKRLCHADLLTLPADSSFPGRVAYSPDGQLLASTVPSSATNRRPSRVKLRHAGTGVEVRALTGPNDLVGGLAFSPDGRRLAVASWDKLVHLWDVETGEEVGQWAGHTDAVHDLAFSPDGALVTGAADGTVRVWDAVKGQVTRTLLPRVGGVWAVAWSPDGKLLAAGGDQAFDVVTWDAATGKEVARCKGHGGGVTALAFHPDGKELASASKDGTVRVWDPATGWQRLVLDGGAGEVRGLNYSRDGRLLASAHQQQVVKLWEARTGRPAGSLRGHKAMVNSAAFSPDGQRLASADDNTVRVWAVTTDQEALALHPFPNAVWALALDPAGRYLAASATDGSVRVFDPGSGKELFAFTHGGKGNETIPLAFTADGARLLAARYLPRRKAVELKEWPLEGGPEQSTFLPSEPYVQVTFGPDGKRFATTSGAAEFKVWDADGAKELFTGRAVTGHPCAVGFSADGSRLASADQEGWVRVWDARTGERLLEFRAHHRLVNGVEFSRDGTLLATASADRTVGTWVSATGQPVHSFAHASSVLAVQFSPDGKRLAAATQGGPVVLWDPDTGRDVLTLHGNGFQAERVRFSPDGTRLVCGTSDGSLLIWDGSPRHEGLGLLEQLGRWLKTRPRPSP